MLKADKWALTRKFWPTELPLSTFKSINRTEAVFSKTTFHTVPSPKALHKLDQKLMLIPTMVHKEKF